MLAGEGPSRTASSESFTWRDSSSQSEYPTTARIPSSRQGRIARQAISPRLAMKIFLKGPWRVKSYSMSFPVRMRSASRYFREVFSTTSGGSFGPGAVLFHGRVSR